MSDTFVYTVIEHEDSEKVAYCKFTYNDDTEQDFIDTVYELIDLGYTLRKINSKEYDKFYDVFGDEKLDLSFNEGVSKSFT